MRWVVLLLFVALVAFGALGALGALGGCVRVAAHQREYLAKPAMNPEAAPLEQKLDTHVEEYREGSMGGTGVGGGGCGCN